MKVLYDLPSQELLINGATLNPGKKSDLFGSMIFIFTQRQRKPEEKYYFVNGQSFWPQIPLRAFFGDLFSDIGGEVTGKFDVKGPSNALYVVGKGRMNDAGLKVNFTQCYYKVEDCDIALTANNINLDGIVLMGYRKNPQSTHLQGGIQ